jgi:diaminopimelate epimerase
LTLDFYKYQGTGNDFILIDARHTSFPETDKSFIAGLCDRHYGIGADGLILLKNHSQGDFYMQYFNSDGAESTMCGNGGRCIAAFANALQLVKNECTFYAIDGVHKAVIDAINDTMWHVKLKMTDVQGITPIAADSFELHTGSPHYVKFIPEDLESFDLLTNARQVRYNDVYKEAGINVNYVQARAEGLSIRTYERGVEDETLSCGTGATAAAIAFAATMLKPDHSYSIHVTTKGGSVDVKFDRILGNDTFQNIWLCGPAVEVFRGQIKI